MQQQPKRSPLSRNLNLHYLPTYQYNEDLELPVNVNHGPLIKEYLDRTVSVFKKAFQNYSRVLILRFDLSFPDGFQCPQDQHPNSAINRFISSLNAQLEYDRVKKESGNRCPVRYIIAREFCPTTGRLHYHAMLLLNGHAYRTLGTKDHQGSFYWRIVKAWSSALNVPLAVADPLVYVSWGRKKTCQYFLDRDWDSSEKLRNLKAAFYRASYLCKHQTKQFGDRERGLMTSRN